MNPSLFCGSPSVGIKNWLSKPSVSANSDLWPQLEGRKFLGTYRGRSAVALACRALGIGPGDEVLMPAYNCGTELDAVLKSGASAVTYRVSKEAEIDLSDLFARLSPKTRAVYIIHYFGWEQPMTELIRWCEDHGLHLVEDCALAMFSDGPSHRIGRGGDVAIFSLPKSLGCMHGGILSLKASRPYNIPVPQPADVSILLTEFVHSTRTGALRVFEKLGLYGPLLALRDRRRDRKPAESAQDYADMPKSYYFQPEEDENKGPHPRALPMAFSLPFRDIVRRRRSNYQQLLEALEGIENAKALYPQLPAEVCPLSLPLIVPKRDDCVKALQARGIAALPWWAGFHATGVNWPAYPEATWLKRNVLTLPIHQGIDARHLGYISETASYVFRSVVRE